MQLLILYDISNDRVRHKVVQALEDYGLDRVQYSAFCGRLNRNLQEELMLLLGAALDGSPARIQLIPIAADDWNKRLELGDGYPL